VGRVRLYRLKDTRSIPNVTFNVVSGVSLTTNTPTGIPTADESNNCQADRTSRLRHSVESRAVIVVSITRPTSAVAVWKPRVITSSGIAIEAVPKPKVACIRLATNSMASVGSTVGSVMAIFSQGCMIRPLSPPSSALKTAHSIRATSSVRVYHYGRRAWSIFQV
jgi:hypothetical protein